MTNKYVEEFMSSVPDTFMDPITGLSPFGEEQLTAVLVAYHQLGKINWPEIRPSALNGQAKANGPSLIENTDILLPEHRLISNGDKHSMRWDNQKPDLIFTNQSISKVILVEAKVDSNFTYGNEPPDGQPSRYFEFLQSLTIQRRALVLLCPRFNRQWYQERIERASEHLGNPIPAYILEWEQIFAAIEG